MYVCMCMEVCTSEELGYVCSAAWAAFLGKMHWEGIRVSPLNYWIGGRLRHDQQHGGDDVDDDVEYNN